MDLVFNNVYLLDAICQTDPSLEVFFKLLMSVPLFARFAKANNGVRQSLYRLHDGWLWSGVGIAFCGPGSTLLQYQHPVTAEVHRIGGPAEIVFDKDGHPIYERHYRNGKFQGESVVLKTSDYIRRTS
jgi:hypothetical protein